MYFFDHVLALQWRPMGACCRSSLFAYHHLAIMAACPRFEDVEPSWIQPVHDAIGSLHRLSLAEVSCVRDLWISEIPSPTFRAPRAITKPSWLHRRLPSSNFLTTSVTRLTKRTRVTCRQRSLLWVSEIIKRLTDKPSICRG